jgi:hypothetical protein
MAAAAGGAEKARVRQRASAPLLGVRQRGGRDGGR